MTISGRSTVKSTARQVLDIRFPLTMALLAFAAGAVAAPLEVFEVTARKRTEDLQDVPIAITAVSGEVLRDNNISRFEDLSPAIPNFSYTESVSGSDQFFVRGIGSGINGGFEQAVGQVVDGIFYGRTRFGRANFLDVKSVEVLKGPQGALIGKNTTAGAIIITSAQPTDEFEAYITPTYEFEGSEGYTVEGAISGPLTDTLSGRLAARWDDRDGYVDNVVNGNQEQGIEDFTIRGKLLWQPNDDFDATLSYQYGNNERAGRTRQLSLCGDIFRNFDPDGPGPAPPGALFQATVAAGEDCVANDSRSTNNLNFGEPVPEAFDIDFNLWGLTMNWGINDDIMLTSVTGYADYDALDRFDLDSIPAELGSADWLEQFEQFSQELRAVSSGDTIDWIAGVYFANLEQKTDFTRNFAALPPPLTPSSNLIATDQETTTIAVFGELTWHISDQWDLTLGGRYTDEEKDATQGQTPTSLYTNDPIMLIPPAGPGAAIHALDQSRSESDFSPQISVQWLPNDNTMVYASAKQGFKGGGFDFQNDGNQQAAADKFQFEDESVNAIELGYKGAFLENTLQLNVAAFYQQFEDLQVSTIDDASATFNVGNAAEATSQGVEADLTWAATDALTITAAAAWLDSTYDDYPGGPCSIDQQLNGTCPNDPDPGLQNLKGKTLPYAPEFSGNVSGEYVWSLSGNLELTAFVLVMYTDEFATVTDVDINTWQESFTKIDARLRLGAADGKWDVALIGRNLTDELTTNFCNDAQGAPFYAGSYFCFVDPPRTVALQGTLRF